MTYVERIPSWLSLESFYVRDPLTHIDSDLCWCNPIVECDRDGRQCVIHKEVTWN
jgi:hypothetical protein